MHKSKGDCDMIGCPICNDQPPAKPPMSERIRVLSFGAGVQSSALLIMMDRGEVKPCDFAVFADTQSEPQEVVDWLAHIRQFVKIPIYVATKGNIAQDMVDHFSGRLKRVGQAPLHALRDGKKGMLRRHCTKEYKIEVVDKFIRKRLGYQPRQKMRHVIEVVMGISYDEMQRMREPQEKWKRFSYPLVDLKLRRADLIKYVEASGIGTPPRSACWFCPYKTNAEWKRLKDHSPGDWIKAVDFDRSIRRSVTPGLTSEFFVHRDAVPLELADLNDGDENQISMLDECEGMCGV